MINPYDWGDHILLVTYYQRDGGVNSCLVKDTHQEHFFELAIAQRWFINPLIVSIMELTEGSADILEPSYQDRGRLIINGEIV